MNDVSFVFTLISLLSLSFKVISIYPCIMPPTLTASQSNRTCNALALMQCVASHKDTRGPFLAGKRLNKSKFF